MCLPHNVTHAVPDIISRGRLWWRPWSAIAAAVPVCCGGGGGPHRTVVYACAVLLHQRVQRALLQLLLLEVELHSATSSGGAYNQQSAVRAELLCTCCATLPPPPSYPVMAQPQRASAEGSTMDKLCVKNTIESFFLTLPTLKEEGAQGHDQKRELAVTVLARLCSDMSTAKDVVRSLLDMGSSLQLANFGDTYAQRTKTQIDTERYVLEAIKKCLLEIRRYFPSTSEKPSPFMSDESLVTKLFTHLDHHYMAPSVEVPQDSDRLHSVAGSLVQLLTSMNLNMARKYLDNILKTGNKFHSLTVVGYFQVSTKDLPKFLRQLNTSPAMSSNRTCKALCRGLHRCILEWCANNPDDFLELWLRAGGRPELDEIRELSMQMFSTIANYVNKEKRRCAMWPCMCALLRLCSTRIKSSIDTHGSKKTGLFNFGSDDECSKFCRRLERLTNQLNLSLYTTPDQKSIFLVSLQVIKDTLDAITVLCTHTRSPAISAESASAVSKDFQQDIAELWKIIGSSEVAGARKLNMHICCELLLEPTKTWLPDFTKTDLAFPIGVLGYEKDTKQNIGKLSFDILLCACKLKKAPNTPLQSLNPFDIRDIWDKLVAQKSKNHYFTLFSVRVIRSIIEECAQRIVQVQDQASPSGLALRAARDRVQSLFPRESAIDYSSAAYAEGMSGTSQTPTKSRAIFNHKALILAPDSPSILLAIKNFDCTLNELCMYLVDVLRQSLVIHYEVLFNKEGERTDQHLHGKHTIPLFWGTQVLRIIAEVPFLSFIPVSSADVEQRGWQPQNAKQIFHEDRGRGVSNCYKLILLMLESGPAKWAANKPYSVLFSTLMIFESLDCMSKDVGGREREKAREQRLTDCMDAIASIFSVDIMPLYYPEAPIEGVLATFSAICAAASEQILGHIKERRPYSYAERGLYLLKYCCHQLLQFMSQNASTLQLDAPNLALLKPRLSDETTPGQWIGQRVEFMVFIAACEVNPSLLLELYDFIGIFCDVLTVFHSTNHPHFALFQSLGSGVYDSAGDMQSSMSGLTHRIHSALRDATFHISRNSFSVNIWDHLFHTWSAYVQQLMATEKLQRAIVSDDENRLESYASFLLLLSTPLWAPGGSSPTGKMRQVFNVFLEFFNKKLVEHIEDWGTLSRQERRSDPSRKSLDFSHSYFVKFLSKTFPSMFCDDLFSCMVDYSKEYAKELQKLCKKYGDHIPDLSELKARYCLPLYCDILLAVLGSLSDSLSQKCLKDLKELSLIIVCGWANNADSKAHSDLFRQRLQHICQVVSAMAKIRSLLPFANGYGFWSLWLQQTYDWAVRLSNPTAEGADAVKDSAAASNDQNFQSVEIFNAINLLLQVLPPNKLEQKDARASDKKYLKFILNELGRPGTFTKDDIQGPLMDGLAAVIKKSTFSVGLDQSLKNVTDLKSPSQQRIFFLKALQKSLQLAPKDSLSSSSSSEAAALHVKFASVINLMFEPPHFFIIHGASKVADTLETDMLSIAVTKLALSLDKV